MAAPDAALNCGSQSMVAPIRSVIIKRPPKAFVDEATIEKSWRGAGWHAAPNLSVATEQHERFVDLLARTGAEILELPTGTGTGMNSIYTHDPALVTEAGVIVFQMGRWDRKGEGQALELALRAWNLPVLGHVGGEATAEGGDFVWLNRTTLLAGRGFRTNAAGIRGVRELVEPLGVSVIEIQLPYWFGPDECMHLMSLISLVDEDLAVAYPRLIPVPMYELLVQAGIQMVEVPESEFNTLGCNVLAVAPRHVLLVDGNPVTQAALEKAGCTVEVFSGREICLMGDGGPTCLTRPILRQ